LELATYVLGEQSRKELEIAQFSINNVRRLIQELPADIEKKNWCLFLTFICPCIANTIPDYYKQDATFLNLFISTDGPHVSGGSSAHHQEHTTVHTASDIDNQ